MGKTKQRLTHLKDLLKERQLTLVEVIRKGPRFVVTRLKKGRQTYVYKGFLPLETDNPNARFWAKNLKREILFLNWFEGDRDIALPRVFDFALSPVPWYIREDIPGTVQSYEGSNFLFQKDFFSKNSLSFADFFYRLQLLTTQIPKSLQHLTRADTVAEPLHGGIVYYHLQEVQKRLPAFLEPALVEACTQFYDRHKEVFFANHSVLSHTEPYASNILFTPHKRYALIDWERLEQADPSHDIAVLWIRGFENPKWQRQLLQRFLASYPADDLFWTLFRFNIVTQQLGNVIHFLANQAQVEGAKTGTFLPFAKASIQKALYHDSFI